MKTILIFIAFAFAATASEVFYVKVVSNSNSVTRTEYRADGAVITNQVILKRQPTK
jgi:predicted 3-demethylubiquinone-9 3-methyltransferase (glyoxalase superfamily)